MGTLFCLFLAVSPPLVRPPPAKIAAPLSLTVDEQTAFAEAEKALVQFEALRFKVPDDADMATWAQAFGAGMQAQAQAMAELQTRYSRLSASARPEIAVPALVRVGEVIEKFAAELGGQQVPAGYDPETRKVLASALAQGAASLLAAAAQQYKAAVDRAQVSGFQGEWVDFARARMAALTGEPQKP